MSMLKPIAAFFAALAIAATVVACTPKSGDDTATADNACNGM